MAEKQGSTTIKNILTGMGHSCVIAPSTRMHRKVIELPNGVEITSRMSQDVLDVLQTSECEMMASAFSLSVQMVHNEQRKMSSISRSSLSPES